MEFLLERSHCVFQQGGWRVLMDASGFQPNSRHWSWIRLRYGATTFVSLGDDVEEGVSLSMSMTVLRQAVRSSSLQVPPVSTCIEEK